MFHYPQKSTDEPKKQRIYYWACLADIDLIEYYIECRNVNGNLDSVDCCVLSGRGKKNRIIIVTKPRGM